LGRCKKKRTEKNRPKKSDIEKVKVRAINSARPEMVIFPNLFVGPKKLRTFISLR
jgi:hypothetical protein